MILDCVNDADEIEPIAVVTDNGGAMRSIVVARWFAARPHFVHVRTRYRSPGTNGVIGWGTPMSATGELQRAASLGSYIGREWHDQGRSSPIRRRSAGRPPQ